MLTLNDVTKSFGSRLVLDKLDLHVECGESVALLGANGSGKTTALRCIAGLARPDSGRIRVAGVDAIDNGVWARRRLSYLPQKSTFPAALTVRETLEFVAKLRGIAASAIDRELDMCGLAALADGSVGHLSGGERQRLAMAIAFLPDTDLYLFDEPTAHLDAAASRILFRRARVLSGEGRTLLFATHVPADVRHLASRVVLLRDGRIAADSAGEFELKRYERLLERDLWGDDYDLVVRRDRVDEYCVDDDRLHDGRAVAGAGARRSR